MELAGAGGSVSKTVFTGLRGACERVSENRQRGGGRLHSL